jgi:FkbM family methyltransferase
MVLRPPPLHDLEIAHEIFVGGAYLPPRKMDPDTIRRVVDVGANVGFSCLWWLSQFPNAHIQAFEPHPAHIPQIRRNLATNSWSDRVVVCAAAAAPSAGRMSLSDRGPESSLIENPEAGMLDVTAIDWFGEIGAEPIDLLKIDIEGGEYALLADPRFEDLPIATLVLEWHLTVERPDGADWCRRRLEQMGFETVGVPGHSPATGLIWAFGGPRPGSAIREAIA